MRKKQTLPVPSVILRARRAAPPVDQLTRLFAVSAVLRADLQALLRQPPSVVFRVALEARSALFRTEVNALALGHRQGNPGGDWLAANRTLRLVRVAGGEFPAVRIRISLKLRQALPAAKEHRAALVFDGNGRIDHLTGYRADHLDARQACEHLPLLPQILPVLRGIDLVLLRAVFTAKEDRPGHRG